MGAVGGLQEIWQLADTLNGLMAAPNLIALFALGRVVAQQRADLLTTGQAIAADPDRDNRPSGEGDSDKSG